MNTNTLNITLNSDKNLVSKDSNTQRILEIRAQSAKTQQARRPSLNLALVLDNSGSMEGDKLEYVKQAACYVLDRLDEQDQVAIVVYDDQVRVLAHSVPVTNSNRFELKRVITRIISGGGTNLADGWLFGCREVAQTARENTINRTLLLTDGQANVGCTDADILSQYAFDLYRDSIITSTFGVGIGFNEQLLEAMANKGGGNFYYIDTPGRIAEIFMKEFNQLVGLAARKVEVVLDIPVCISWQVLGGWQAEYKSGKLHIFVGDMLAAKTQDIYLKLDIPALTSSELSLNGRIYGQGEPGQVVEAEASLVFQVASQSEVEAAAVNKAVMERFGMVELADEAAEALKLERQGLREAAERRLKASVNRNRPYIAMQTSRNYDDLSQRMKTGMDEADRKQTHYNNYRQRRSKEEGEDK